MGRGRPQLHTEESILDAARDLVLSSGARAATVNAIIAASGAPKGSIYHRFASLDELLAAMWIRAVKRSQETFIQALQEPDALKAAIAAALSIHDFARHYPADARLLASLRREDLIETVSSAQLQRELAQLNRPLQNALTELARRLFDRSDPDHIEQTVFAVVDLPIGATRRHLIAGTPLPQQLRAQLAAAVRAAILQASANRRRSPIGSEK